MLFWVNWGGKSLFLRVGAVFVFAPRAFGAGQDEIVHGDEDVPPRFAYVVHTPNGNGDGRQQDDEVEQQVERAEELGEVEKNAEGRERHRNEEVDQHVVPVLAAAGAAVEIGEVAKGGNVVAEEGGGGGGECSLKCVKSQIR